MYTLLTMLSFSSKRVMLGVHVVHGRGWVIVVHTSYPAVQGCIYIHLFFGKSKIQFEGCERDFVVVVAGRY